MPNAQFARRWHQVKTTKMKQTIFFKLILLAIFITGIPSCQDEDMCGDLGGPYIYDARIIDFQVEIIEKQVAPTEWQPYQQGETVNANELVIYLKSYNEQIAFHERTIRGGLFMNSAYACSPARVPRTDQEFVSLTITSTEDYDTDHPAGSDLIELFLTRGEQDGVNDPKMPLSQHLAMNSDYFILNPPTLFLSKSPDNISTHTFKFELELSDTTFNFQTPEVILK